MGKFKVLVVDDEKPARETLACLIDWEATAFTISATAKNGREALEKYRDLLPDLVITDIQMPVMDGLTLIKNIKRENQKSKFVILSCHEKFSYAREAIRMGVTDYLIKDLITPQDLYSVLLKVSMDLAEQKAAENKKPIPEEQIEFYDASKSMALQAIVLEDRPVAEKQALAEKYAIAFKSKYFALMAVCLDDYPKKLAGLDHSAWKAVEKGIYVTVKKTLADFSGGDCFYHVNGQFVVAAQLNETVSQLEFISRSYEIAHRLQRNIQDSLNLSVTIGISRAFNGFNDICRRYKEALEVTGYKLFLGKGRILFYDTACSRMKIAGNDIVARLKHLRRLLDDGRHRELSREISTIYREDMQSFMQYNYLKGINAQMFDLVMEACKNYNIGYESLFGCNYIPLQQVENMDTAAEMGEWFAHTFTRMMELRSLNENKKYSRHITEAIDYIAVNYRENIGLSRIASALNLHKVYLCRLFKQETGENLVNYILKVRIKEAQRLILSSNLKIYEIAEKVGYNNIQQFSAAFKKIAGVTPSEFRDTNKGR